MKTHSFSPLLTESSSHSIARRTVIQSRGEPSFFHSVIQSFIPLLFSLSACGQQTFEQKLEGMYRQTVPLMQPSTLDSLRQAESVVLLDARSPEEYKVSHLPSARFVNYDTFRPEDISDIPTDAEVVVYCAVGYRSERVGEQLQEVGYQNVHNLYGGIFAWKNRGYPVVNPQSQVTDSVHTYNRRWSKWLERGVKVW